jgi:hypothetical protein
MGTVLRVGVIVLPLVAFLALFGQNIISYFVSGEEAATTEANELRDQAGTSAFGN